MDIVRWGIIGCGDVTEVKSGPALQQANGSVLAAVMRRSREKAADYARRHGVPRFYDRASDLVADPGVDAVYVATPPSSHCSMALLAAAAGKPCLVEKPMAMNHAECQRMLDAFRAASLPLFVAYYRRALQRYVRVRELVQEKAIGMPRSVHVVHTERLATREQARAWRFDPSVAGAGLFFDLGSHALDLLDFFFGPIASASGCAFNTGGHYDAEDVTGACFGFEKGLAGTGIWNFNAEEYDDGIIIRGTLGTMWVPVFADEDVELTRKGTTERLAFRNPPHVHLPLVQGIVDELLGRGVRCPSTGVSAARTSWVMDCCVESYYSPRPAA